AEDGIRDLTVTGVQTCALPIFIGGAVLGDDQRIGVLRLRPRVEAPRDTTKIEKLAVRPDAADVCDRAFAQADREIGEVAVGRGRSEERREGKSVDLGG